MYFKLYEYLIKVVIIAEVLVPLRPLLILLLVVVIVIAEVEVVVVL